jgi:hypothetical protein
MREAHRIGVRPGVEVTLALFVVLGGACLYLGPAMGWSLSDALGPDQGDPLLYVYLVKWLGRALADPAVSFWDAPFYHPLPGVIAFSDHLLGPGLLVAMLRAGGASALAAYNLLYFGQFVAAGLAAWWVIRRCDVSFTGALVGAWFFAFGHFRWDEQSHFNVLLIATIPLVLWTFDRLLAVPSAARAAAFVLVYAAHLSGGVYLAYLVHVPLALLMLNRFAALRDHLRSGARKVPPLAAAAAAAALLLSPLYVGYASRSAELGAERRLRDLRPHSSTLASFVSASSGSPLEREVGWLPRNAGRGALFPGFAVGLCAAAGGIAGWRRYRRPLARRSTAWTVAGACGALLAALALVAADRFTVTGERLWLGVDLHGYRGPLLAFALGGGFWLAAQRALRDGPVARWRDVDAGQRGLLLTSAVTLLLCLPAFYWLLWSALPGMRGTRVSHRFFAFAALGIALLAGKGFDRLRERLGARSAKMAIGIVVVLATVLESSPALRPWTPLAEEDDLPDYVHYLARADDVTAYLQLPIYGDWRDLRTMYLQTPHWRPLVNGSSSFVPPRYEWLAEECTELTRACWAELREAGVSHLVLALEADPDWTRFQKVDADRRLRRGQRAVRRRVAAGSLVEVYRGATGRVFRFVRAGAGASGPARFPAPSAGASIPWTDAGSGIEASTN